MKAPPIPTEFPIDFIRVDNGPYLSWPEQKTTPSVSINRVSAIYVINPKLITPNDSYSLGKPFLFAHAADETGHEYELRNTDLLSELAGLGPDVKPFAGGAYEERALLWARHRDNRTLTVSSNNLSAAEDALYKLPAVVCTPDNIIELRRLFNWQPPFTKKLHQKSDVDTYRIRGNVRHDFKKFSEETLPDYERRFAEARNLRWDYEQTLASRIKRKLGLEETMPEQ